MARGLVDDVLEGFLSILAAAGRRPADAAVHGRPADPADGARLPRLPGQWPPPLPRPARRRSRPTSPPRCSPPAVGPPAQAAIAPLAGEYADRRDLALADASPSPAGRGRRADRPWPLRAPPPADAHRATAPWRRAAAAQATGAAVGARRAGRHDRLRSAVQRCEDAAARGDHLARSDMLSRLIRGWEMEDRRAEQALRRRPDEFTAGARRPTCSPRSPRCPRPPGNAPLMRACATWTRASPRSSPAARPARSGSRPPIS